jgi:ferredoxin
MRKLSLVESVATGESVGDFENERLSITTTMSNISHYTVDFPNTDCALVNIDIHQPLSVSLTLQNSPILFGCRTGICGTCLVIATGDMVPPDAAEQEVLEIFAPNCPTARLACQIKPLGSLSLTRLTP